VQVAYKNATAAAFHSVYWNEIQTFFKRVDDPTTLTLPAAYVNQSLKNWTRSPSYMRASFVDPLLESVS